MRETGWSFWRRAQHFCRTHSCESAKFSTENCQFLTTLVALVQFRVLNSVAEISNDVTKVIIQTSWKGTERWSIKIIIKNLEERSDFGTFSHTIRNLFRSDDRSSQNKVYKAVVVKFLKIVENLQIYIKSQSLWKCTKSERKLQSIALHCSSSVSAAEWLRHVQINSFNKRNSERKKLQVDRFDYNWTALTAVEPSNAVIRHHALL